MQQLLPALRRIFSKGRYTVQFTDSLALAFNVQITRDEARRLLESVSISKYEGHARNLNMPFSDERAVVVSLTYNRGAGRMATHMQGFNNAIRDGDRAEAWYQLRYNSRGTNPDPDVQLGLRARRNMESQILGLYTDPLNVTPDEARKVYRMFQLHHDDILENERNWGVDFDGNEARTNAIMQANSNYQDMVKEYGKVQTLASALEPARNRLLEELRAENPELAYQLQNRNFATTAIYLDPGREFRSGNNLRQDQRNNTAQDFHENHAVVLDSRRMQGNAEIASNDLLIGDGGDDILRSHRGNDVLIGGKGRDRMEGGEGYDTYVIDAGDTVMDNDGVGEVRWSGQQLSGGRRSQSDPANTYCSEDGRFIYTFETSKLSVADTLATDQAQREPAAIENFQNGQLGITLSGPGDVTRLQPDPQRADEQQRRRMIDIDHEPHNAHPLAPTSAPEREDRQSQRDAERGPFNDPYINRAYAALLDGDSRELDRVAIEFSQSPEGQRMAQMGDRLLAQQQLLEQQQLREQQQMQVRQVPVMSR